MACCDSASLACSIRHHGSMSNSMCGRSWLDLVAARWLRLDVGCSEYNSTSLGSFGSLARLMPWTVFGSGDAPLALNI